LDYIRTVNFHIEYPWLVSASDDQTIRIWNWQSRSCVSVLTGHNHYVMCASFHVKDDLIVSASLDQTVRVWDITGLRKKTVRGATPGATPALQDAASASSVVSRVNSDLFGGNDAVVKYVLEGHDRGVNWASFHPTLPLIISGADDRQVKLWRMNETKAWEVDTMRGHNNNVSCVVFHPKQELIISNSEDRSIRVWDISKRLGVQTFRRENDRFWILAAHSNQNLLAAGHDSGMIVFKLERERPAFATYGKHLFYVKERYLRQYDISNGNDVPLLPLRRPVHMQSSLGNNLRSLEYNSMNPSEHSLLLFSDVDGGSYELLAFAKDTAISEGSDAKRGAALAAVFFTRNRIAILDKNRQIVIRDAMNEKRKAISFLSNASPDGMFFGGSAGRVLIRSDDKMILFEPQSRRVLGEIQAARVKYIAWNHDASYVALVSKHGVIIANKELEQLCSITETVRVKGGAWDNSSRIFVYTTLNHIKYCIPNGDSGLVRTLDVPIYITEVQAKKVICIDRECRVRVVSVDLTEAMFKLALDEKNYRQVMQIVRQSHLCGKAIINYLDNKGFAEVALHFVDDLRSRFKLALACGNIEVATDTAHEIGSEDCWNHLAIEAMRQGNYKTVEMAYQRIKNFERLSFLYFITGQNEKLRKMLKIAEMRKDIMAQYHNTLFLGDVVERCRILEIAGLSALAQTCAQAHALDDETQDKNNGQLLLPPTPIIRADNWPLLAMSTVGLYNTLETKDETFVSDDQEVGGWGLETSIDDDLGGPDNNNILPNEENDGWGDDLDLGEDIDTSQVSKEQVVSSEKNLIPTPGVPPPSLWCRASSHAAHHAAAGSLVSSMNLLNRQIAATNFAPLKSKMLQTFHGVHTVLPGHAFSVPMTIHLSSQVHENPSTKIPASTFLLSDTVDNLKIGYRHFQKGNFSQAKESFISILLSIPLIVVDTRSAVNEVKELVEISREYITAIRLKNANAETEGVRQLELSALFTHCKLQPVHLMLALNLAMSQAYKLGNFITAAGFARRILELPDTSSGAQGGMHRKAELVLQKSEKQARNEFTLNYDERNPFVVDCNQLIPIFHGTASIQCAFCGSSYSSDAKDSLCSTCNVATIGVETIGLINHAQMNKF